MNVHVVSLYLVGNCCIHLSQRAPDNDARDEDPARNGCPRCDHGEEVPNQKVIEHAEEWKVDGVVKHRFDGFSLLHERERG